MNTICKGALLIVAATVCGCGGGFGGVKTRLALSAVPLEPLATVIGDGKCTLRGQGDSNPSGKIGLADISVTCSNFEKVHIVAYESQAKCNDFITLMFAANAATNMRLDLLTTFLTSVASVTTPTRVAHTLTAGAAISSGAKLSVNNEYFNALTISHIVQAIQQSYATDMASYLENLDNLPDGERGKISFLAEIPRIQAIHSECSLAAAEATIATTLQAGARGTSKPENTAPIDYPTSYTIINNETNKDIAKGVAMALNANLDLRRLTVSADVDSVTKTKVDLKRTDTKVAVDWSASVAPADSKLKVDFAKDSGSFTVSGAATDGDVVTITATPRKAPSVTSTTATGAASTPTTSLSSSAAARMGVRGKVPVMGEALQRKQ